MGRRMEIDGRIFRAVVSRPGQKPNPAYDWNANYYNRDRSIPAYLPDPENPVVTVYGPYSRKGDATVCLNQAMKNGYGEPVEGVHGHIEEAVIAWKVVE